jgi:hypothetical protein
MPPVKSSFTWNPERVAKLRELVASGLSSAAIAVALGVSRGAVCSARVRYGIVPTARPQRQRQPEPARPARRAAQSTSARAPWSIWPASPRLEPEPLPPVDPFDLAIAGVPLIELEAGAFAGAHGRHHAAVLRRAGGARLRVLRTALHEIDSGFLDGRRGPRSTGDRNRAVLAEGNRTRFVRRQHGDRAGAATGQDSAGARACTICLATLMSASLRKQPKCCAAAN